MAADPYRYFRLEARELLDQCAESVLELEKGGPGAALVQRLLRLVHTLKGAARVVRQAEIADRAHAIEDALTPFRDAATNVTRDEIGPILNHLDDIDQRLRMLTPVEPVALAAAKPPSDEPTRTIRADVVEMDMVLDGVAETHGLLRKCCSPSWRSNGIMVAHRNGRWQSPTNCGARSARSNATWSPASIRWIASCTNCVTPPNACAWSRREACSWCWSGPRSTPRGRWASG
jgi:two-component system chemotaxis sensor kinase CheA